MKILFLLTTALLFSTAAQSAPLTYQDLENISNRHTEASNNYRSGYYRGLISGLVVSNQAAYVITRQHLFCPPNQEPVYTGYLQHLIDKKYQALSQKGAKGLDSAGVEQLALWALMETYPCKGGQQ